MKDDVFFNFIVPVWGESYTRLFTETCLPMLLTKDNLYARTYTEHDRFTIATTWESYCHIKQSAAFAALEKIITVNFILIDGLVDLHKVYRAMSYCYAQAMQQPYVIPTKTYFFFLTPDSFWSEGTFKRMFELAAEKYQVVMAMGLRVNAEDMSNDIANLRNNPTSEFSLPNEKLLPLVFKNLHHISKSHNFFSKEGFINKWPSHLYWIDEGINQLIAHCFHLHPLMVQSPAKQTPIGKTIDAEFLDNLGYSLDNYYICQEKYFGIELSKADRQWDHKLDAKPSMKKIIRFSLQHADKVHWHLAKHRIIIGNQSSIAPALEKLINDTVHCIPCIRKNKQDQVWLRKPFLLARKFLYSLLDLPTLFRKIIRRVLTMSKLKLKRSV